MKLRIFVDPSYVINIIYLVIELDVKPIAFEIINLHFMHVYIIYIHKIYPIFLHVSLN